MEKGTRDQTSENRAKHLAQDLKETKDRYDILQGELEKSLAMNGVLRTSLQQCRDESNPFQSENAAFKEQVKELKASLCKCEIHVKASEEFAINKAVELTSKLQKAKQEIQKRDEDMKSALTQAREVALQVADLADAAMPLSQNLNSTLENEGRLTRLFDEIKKLGSKAHHEIKKQTKEGVLTQDLIQQWKAKEVGHVGIVPKRAEDIANVNIYYMFRPTEERNECLDNGQTHLGIPSRALVV
ncbi:hypothetical protein GQ457_09G021320 [Hibiscus cannabinus]